MNTYVDKRIHLCYHKFADSSRNNNYLGEKKMTKLKKLISIILALMVLVVLASCSVEPEQPMETVQGADNVVTQLNNDNNLGDYMVEIKGCRMAEDYQGNPIVIVTYSFTNNIL